MVLPLKKAGGSSNSEAIFIKKNYWDLGVLTHEMAHQYLQKSTKRLSFYFPRWFDEGLATYLGSTGRLKKFTTIEELTKTLNSGFYERDLGYWNGLFGVLRWTLKDIRYRPSVIYTETYGFTIFKFHQNFLDYYSSF